ncbi:class A sortase [Lentilactobacillus raoultii]|uniref:Class A sortase n=1 Tax=Lentilactobacillus raoultii TaxID=1987503 RepID=A0ABW3PKF3_9LACO|nr:class A sortase [Lentilactobacillus raoultii]
MRKTGQPSRGKRLLTGILMTILILISLGLIFNRQLAMLLVRHNQSQLDHLPKTTLVQNSQHQHWQKHPAKVKNFSNGDAVKSMSQTKQNRQATIAYLNIPRINVHLPILYQVTNAHLSVGVATLRASEKLGQGNFVIFGHNFENSTMLSNLQKLRKGNQIETTNGRHTYRYRVTQNIVINEYNWHYTKPSHQKIITVITCADGGATRQIVRGKLVAIS